MGYKLEEVRALAHRRHWRIAPIRPEPGKYVLFRGSAESCLPPMTLAQIHRWLMLPARQCYRADLPAARLPRSSKRSATPKRPVSSIVALTMRA
jgi:hypothetical protein